MAKRKGLKTKTEIRKEAAKKGWETRRAKMTPEERRTAAAKKGWDTRRAKMTPQERRSAAARKGWETRRAKMTPEERRTAAAKKGRETRRKNTPEFKRRSAAAKKGWETRRDVERGFKVLHQIRSIIDTWAPEPYWSPAVAEQKALDVKTLKNLLEGAIDRDGEKAVAVRLEENAEASLSWVQTICWESNQDHVNMALASIAAVINGKPLTSDEAKDLENSMEDAFDEEAEDLFDFWDDSHFAKPAY